MCFDRVSCLSSCTPRYVGLGSLATSFSPILIFKFFFASFGLLLNINRMEIAINFYLLSVPWLFEFYASISLRVFVALCIWRKLWKRLIIYIMH